MMNSFGWKRKVDKDVGQKVNKVFLTDDSNAVEECEDIEMNWIENMKKRKVLLLESAGIKCERLKEEGCILAEAERFWEALRRWDDALRLNPNDYKLYEMKAQVCLALHEIFPAVQAAEMAVKLNPVWWIGHRTLGRTQLGLGEVKLALRSFCKAGHLQPDEREIWDEDISWAQSLLKQHETIHAEEKATIEEHNSSSSNRITIKELDSNSPDRSDGLDISLELKNKMIEFQQSRKNSKTDFNKSWVKLRHPTTNK